MFDKQQLMEVKLAATRARWLREMIGIDLASLNTLPIEWGWQNLLNFGTYYDFYWGIKVIRKLRKSLPEGDGTGSKVILLTALEAARRDFNTSAALVTEPERETRTVCGIWTLKEVAGHLADWDDMFMKWMRIGLGEDVPQFPFNADGDAQNATMAEARKDKTWLENWADCQNTRQALIDKLEKIEEIEINRRYSGKRRTFPTVYHCAWSALEHYLDHAAILRRELGVPIPKFLLTFKGPYT